MKNNSVEKRNLRKVSFIKDDKTSFYDKLDNELEPGTIICFASQSELKIGVFAGIVEKWTWESTSSFKKMKSSYHKIRFKIKYVKKTGTEKKVRFACFLTMASNKIRKHFIEYKDGEKNIFSKFCAINEPLYYVNNTDVCASLKLINYLEDNGVIDKKNDRKLDNGT